MKQSCIKAKEIKTLKTKSKNVKEEEASWKSWVSSFLLEVRMAEVQIERALEVKAASP